jgi:hypothetical protein
MVSLSPSLLVMSLMAASGKSRLLSARFRTEACRRRRVAEGGLHLLGEVNVLNCRVKCFRKHVLSFEAPSASYPCNLKLMCNYLIFNEIMILNASYVCLHAFLLHRESPDVDPKRQTPHF